MNNHNEKKAKTKPKENKEAENIVKDISNDLIGAIPKQAELKRSVNIYEKIQSRKDWTIISFCLWNYNKSIIFIFCQVNIFKYPNIKNIK